MTQAERLFLETYDKSQFESPLATVDTVIFTVFDDVLKVLLVKRAEHPEKGKWALPGGFIDLLADETIEDTAFRKLKEKTGVSSPYLEQVETVGNAHRDKRGWALTILYFALINHSALAPKASAVEDAQWLPVTEAVQLSLAFDHANLLASATNRLRSKTRYSALPLQLMDRDFTLSELQRMFETVLGSTLEKKSFRRRILSAGLLEETGEMKPTERRPAALYRRKERARGDFEFPGNLFTHPAKIGE